MIKVGYIGTGNMGSALATGASKNAGGNFGFYLSDLDNEKATKLQNEIGGTVVDIKALASTCDYIFLCVKPQGASDTLNSVKEELLANKNVTLISIVTAWTTKRIKDIVDVPVIRIMPNTPCLINQGIIVYDYSKDVKKESVDVFLKLVSGIGLVEKVEEKDIDAISAVSGCGPAFADMFVDAMAEELDELGIDKQKAINYASQMLIGAGSLIISSGKDPNQLKKEVCSPGGSTIEGVYVLENNNFKQIVKDAVKASFEKNSKL